MSLSLQSLPGIGPKTLERLNKLGISTTKDLLYHFPLRYLDFSKHSPISDLREGDSYTIKGQLLSFKNIYTRSHKNIQKATISDSTGQIELIWFNQPYLEKNFKVGDTYHFAGSPTLFQNRLTIIAPEYSLLQTNRIVPIYPQTQGLNSKFFQKLFSLSLNDLLSSQKDPLPIAILKKYSLLSLSDSLRNIHQPQNQALLEQARHRLSLDEILNYQSLSHLSKKEWLSKKAQNLLKSDKTIDNNLASFTKSLPFKLTPSQTKVWAEVKKDLLSQKKVTNRLIQGDVGSGKTIVAILATYLTQLNHKHSLILAPTQVLANQHYQTFKKLLPKNTPLKLIQSASNTKNGKTKKELSPQKGTIYISTHAAIFQKDSLPPISLLIIDEQHKFGVKQRNFLEQKDKLPHTLTMTATPIPRTISLTFLGNLDLSFIDLPPKDRLPIKTHLIPSLKVPDCYNWVKDKIKKEKAQAYIVCPLIEESESLASVSSVKKEYLHLQKEVFPDLKIGLIHGKLKAAEKDKIIKDFKDHKLHILLSTPIIEVGVDIPNSTIIIIQSAQRFGLAQLHQLRGRVGRGAIQSYCFLFADPNLNPKSLSRLEYLQKHHSGQKIAEFDLKTRGPGEIFNTLQHGFPSLKLAQLSDTLLVSKSQLILNSLVESNFNLEKLLIQKPQKALSSLQN